MVYIVIVLVLVVALLLLHRPTKERVKKVSSDVVGVCAVALERSSQKEARKSRVLELLTGHGELSNSDIRRELNVSRNTVVRYMNELEAEGKVKQVGTTGRGVIYQLQ